MARLRLRFLLQEFDLPQGTIILGRSPDCHVTIEDALVSRAHAKIEVRGERAFVSDLGSRNGVHVNGSVLVGTRELLHNDRVRIGKQDLLFSCIDTPSPAVGKTTGFLQHCAQCKFVYPQEAGACPSCGSTEVATEDTLSVRRQEAEGAKWQLGFLLGMLAHLIKSDRLHDAERIALRISTEAHEQAQQGVTISDEEFLDMCEVMGRYALAAKAASWACWLVIVHQEHHRLPAPKIETILLTLLANFPEMKSLLLDLMTSAETSKNLFAPSGDVEAVTGRVQALRETLLPSNVQNRN
jgi:hypothetical protein